MEKQKGITLIALIVTIIVLIILAGISINLILGENGIITKAQEAKQGQEIADLKSEMQLEIAAREAEKLQNSNGITLEEMEQILLKYGMLNKENGEIVSLTPTGKDYEIELEEIYSGNLASSVPSELERYFLGENKEGVDFLTIAEPVDNSEDLDMIFIGNSIIEDANKHIIYLDYTLNEENLEFCIDVFYKDKSIYNVKIDPEQMKTISIKKKSDSKKIAMTPAKCMPMSQMAIDKLGLEENLSLAKQYVFEYLIDGEIFYVRTNTTGYLILAINKEYKPGLWVDMSHDYILGLGSELEFNSIYEVGIAKNVLEENGFTIWYDTPNSVWELISSPSGEYVIPTQVAGREIGEVELSGIQGIPTFTKGVLLTHSDVVKTTKIRVTTENLEFIYNLGVEIEELDLSKCGDDIVIPVENFLEEYEKKNTNSNGLNWIIYVSPAVKQRYADYNCVVAKE